MRSCGVKWGDSPQRALRGGRELLPSPQPSPANGRGDLLWRGGSNGDTREDFHGNYHGLVRAHKRDENGLVPGTGNHKGCPNNRFAGAYFHSN